MIRSWRDYNFVLLGCVLVLSVFSMALVYSTTNHGVYTSSGVYVAGYFIRHVINVVVGIGAMFVLTFVDYNAIQHWSWPLYIVAIGLLAFVLAKGTVRGGAQSWLDFGVRSLQPSEIAKLLMVIVLAAFWSRREERSNTWYAQLGSLLVVGVPLGLVFIQPDFGTSFVIALAWAAMAWAAGIRLWQIGLLLLLMLPVAYYGWTHVLEGYQRDRLLIFTDPQRYDPGLQGDGWNVAQSLNAISSGGMTGKGWMHGPLTQNAWLPVAYTDFIFAATSEELGFFGGTMLILFECILLWQGITVARVARDTFGRLLAIGITAIFFCHIMVNVGMNMSIMPVTGIPLPFISYGGSFTLVTFAAVGMLQSVALRRRRSTYG